MHALIVGERRVGKSTLIHRVLEALDVSVCGFETKKEQELEDPVYGNPIYIYEAGQPHEQHEENCVGYCKDQKPKPNTEVFDRFAEKFQEFPGDHDMILMDEIGFLEKKSEAFCKGILSVLDGETPVIAAVKTKEIPFLETVRNHPNCRCFYITEENRDDLVGEVIVFVKEQLNR